MILESVSKAYCDCSHEYNEHRVVPPSYNPTGNPTLGDHACKICGCRKFKKNDKDKRNTPPVKFFPR